MSRHLPGFVFMLASVAAALGCGPHASAPGQQTPPMPQAPPVYPCGPSPPNIDHSNDDNMSAKALELLKVAEDGMLPCRTRIEAVHKLGNLGERAAVDRLAKLLPGNSDTLTGAVLIALGDIGGSKALTVLENCEGNPAYDNGKLQVELHYAIKNCQKDP